MTGKDQKPCHRLKPVYMYDEAVKMANRGDVDLSKWRQKTIKSF